MHVERGFAPEQSTVTVHSTMTMLAAGDHILHAAVAQVEEQ